MSSTQTNTTVALVCQTQELGRHLRDALASLGTSIVYETTPADLDLAALASSGARVVVVNLDPAVEAHLDEVYGLLEDDRYSVVFNDAQASSALSGWDQARWARHLAAKIRGGMNIDPPRPEGAQAIPAPSPAATVTPRADAASIAGEPIADEAIVTETIASEPVADEAAVDADNVGTAPDAESVYAAHLRSIIEGTLQEPVTETVDAGNPLDMLESRYDEMSQPTTAAYPAPQPPADEFDFSTLEALTGLSMPPPESAPSTFTSEFLDAPAPSTDAADEPASLTYSSEFPDESTPFAAEPAPDAADVPLADVFDLAALDMLFGDEETNAPAVADTPTDVGPIDVGDLGELDTIELASADTDGDADAIAAHRIDSSALALVDEISFEIPAPAAKETAPPVSSMKLAAAADWSLEDMLEGDAPPPAPAPTGRADFGIEKLSAAEYLAPPTENTAPPPIPDGDFSLELMPLEEAVAPQAIEREAYETWLDPDKVVVPPKIRRVWVLGASIGGPEAVREFLGELPRDYPALFLLAQHMGAEFVDLMAQQLAKSTPLTVRTPTHGERVGHGEVVIVPTTHRLQVDPEGIIVLERTHNESAYSPSIDRVLRDVADRYGANAGVIIFSGMTTDSVEGSKYLAGKGGTIYAQHPDTCVVSSMVDGAVEAGIVKFLGSPKELAEVLLAEAVKGKR